jgi:hypothetical protein
LDDKEKTFIKDNNITEPKTDPTQKFQRTTQNIIKQCKGIIKPEKRKYVTQMNPQAPKLMAKIKIHKTSASIRPVISSIYAPTHKIAIYVHQNTKELINLKYEYNIRNTMQFAENISIIKLGPEHKLLPMDIKDLYVKIPVGSTLNIANKLLVNNWVEKQNRKDIMMILKMIMNQNYFQYEEKFYKPATGVAMGSPL